MTPCTLYPTPNNLQRLTQPGRVNAFTGYLAHRKRNLEASRLTDLGMQSTTEHFSWISKGCGAVYLPAYLSI
jgi:hypothetical protein